MLGKYRILCLTEAANVNSAWVTDVPTTCPNNVAHVIDASATVLLRSIGSALMHITCGDETKYESKVTATSWTCVRRFWYGGSDAEGAIQAVSWLIHCTTGAGMSIRLRDVTNNLTLAKKEDQTNTTPTNVYDMNLNNIPADGAILELQVKVASVGETAYVSDMALLS
jgi:hypothetical protein